MKRHVLLESPDLGRPVHLWAWGHWGPPVVAFPTAAGMAHEWEAQGMIGALWPLLEHGRLKLYCVETNVAETLTRGHGDPRGRIDRHRAYERFVTQTLVPAVRADGHSADVRIGAVGASLGALYAVHLTLQHPETFGWALGLSGRYEVRPFLGGFDNDDVYFSNPLAWIWNLHGADLDRARRAAVTLVCGQGPWEDGCLEDTLALGRALDWKGIPHEVDIQGHDVSHEWPWWHRQAAHHLGRRLR